MSNPSLANLQALREELCSADLDQSHLFNGWPETEDQYTADQIALLTELYRFQLTYPGGVQQYVRNGRQLLSDESAETALTQLEMPPHLFYTPSLYHRSDELEHLEAAGEAMLKKSVFVLVAGGLGERLGYSSIKVGLPVETATGRTYLEHYLGWVRRACGTKAPFVIMTSEDTHERTLRLLDDIAPDDHHVRLLKQETVFCFVDSAAHLACEGGVLLRKPHGHGDVHSLIHAATEEGCSTPLIDAWKRAGYEYLVFLQDTNAPAIHTIPISLAVSEREGLDMNFTCIPRHPKEAIGLLCYTKMDDEGPWRTSNIENNIFEVVSRNHTKEGGDVAAANSEYSSFPGSINTLVFKLGTYRELLQATSGAVPEFINPKYTDSTHRTFKKPARIESLMQDFALLYTEGPNRVGGTVFERFLYQPVKNSLVEAARKVREEASRPYCAISSEADFYELMRRRMKAVGVPLFYESAPDIQIAGMESELQARLFPIITMDAAARGHGTLRDLAVVFPTPGDVHVSARSTLILRGRVVVESLTLDGALIVCGPAAETEEPPLVIREVEVRNGGWSARQITPSDAENEVDCMRGFVLVKSAGQVISSTSTVSDAAKL